MAGRRGRRSWLAWTLLFVVAGCGDGDPHERDGSPGTVIDAGEGDAAAPDVDGAVPAPDAGRFDAGPGLDAATPDAAPSDAAMPDAGPSGPSLDSVETIEGSNQVRQGSTVVLVLRGSGLGAVTAVAVGEMTATVMSASADEVRAEVTVPHGTAPGLREVTASWPEGSVGLADAIATTLYIASPTGQPGGRGTFDSPLLLCDPEIATAADGDTISLLAGEHVCNADQMVFVGAGVTVAGAGPAETMVRGADASFPGFYLGGGPAANPSALRDFGLITPAPLDSGGVTIYGPATVEIDDLHIEGEGVVSYYSVAITANRLEVDCEGASWGLAGMDSATVTAASSRFTGCQYGVASAGGAWTVTDAVVERCAVGVWADRDRNFSGQLDLVSSELDDNTYGVQIVGGSARVTDTVIRDVEVTPESMTYGILVNSASLELTGGEIVGHDQTGVSIFASVEGPSFYATITDALVVGGVIGVDADGRDNQNTLIMRDSVIRDQTYAAARLSTEWQFVTLDLGNGGGSGGNQLSVVSGIALRDDRPEPDEFSRTIDATGITLNGRSYAGQLVEGPANQPPDYSILADGQIQF